MANDPIFQLLIFNRRFFGVLKTFSMFESDLTRFIQKSFVTSNCHSINVSLSLGGDRGLLMWHHSYKLSTIFMVFMRIFLISGFVIMKFHCIQISIEISNAAFSFVFIFLYAVLPITSERHLLEHIYLCLFGFRPF